MKPLRLDLQAFGPFGDTASVDFEPLAELGLFVVSGPTGAGKTSIFDAMAFALFGSLPGNRSGHLSVRSDHAEPDVECEVTFEFSLGTDRWQVWRKPKQHRAKKVGTGTTEVAAEAAIAKWDGTSWERIDSGSQAVTNRCKALIGLTVDQFERVVLLPQGQFQQVLNATSSERAKLLRTLFGSDRYEAALEDLKQQASALARSLGDVGTRRQQMLDNAGDQVRLARTTLAIETSDEDTDASTDADPASIRADVEALRAGPLAAADRSAALAEAAAEAATRAHQRFADQTKAIERRAQYQARLADLEAARADHDQRAAAVALAHRSAPVIQAQDRLDAGVARTTTAHADLSRTWGAAHAAVAGTAVLEDTPTAPGADAAAEALGTVANAAQGYVEDLAVATRLEGEAAERRATLATLRAESAALDAQVSALENEQESLEASHQDATVLAAQRPARQSALDAATAALARRDALAQAETALEAAVGALDASKAALVQHQAAAEARRVRIAELLPVAEAVAARRAARIDADDAVRARQDLDEVTAALSTAAKRATEARAVASDTFDRFLAGTAPRLARALVSGEPCAVCGATDHPAPAIDASDTDDAVEATHVEHANADASAADAEHRETQARLTALLGTHPGLADRRLTDLVAAAATATADLAAAEAARDEVTTLRSDDETERHLADALRSKLEAQTQVVDGHRSKVAEARGALGEDATRDRADLEARLATARKALDEAADAAQHVITLTDRRQAIAELTTAHAARARDIRDASTKATTEAEAAETKAAALRRQVQEAIGDADPAERAQAATAARRLVGDAAKHLATLESCEQAESELRSELASAVALSEFADVAAARAAAMDPAALADAVATCDRWQKDHDDAVNALAEFAAQGLPETAPDVEGAERAAREAVEAAAAARGVAGAAAHHLTTAATAIADADALDDANREDRERHQLVASTAETIAGNNPRRTTLESWVLASYLRDVVDHANIHLSTMTSDRYQLVVEDEPTDKRRTAGLGLAIQDTVSGSRRATVSLSGGETFQASLALALGLADVVLAGRSGLDLDALFIDEGFGSLDPNSVDQAVTVLDGLRTRGSMVGIITHVESMKTALPVAIEVTPRADRRGSQLHQLVGTV